MVCRYDIHTWLCKRLATQENRIHSVLSRTAEEPLDGGSRTEEVEEKTPEIGVLDVVKAIAPLLVIIGLAVGMLVLGYLFVPETLSTGYCTPILLSVCVHQAVLHYCIEINITSVYIYSGERFRP